jgi:hypothetical protein
MPFPSTKDVATEATRQLTHVILHPQLAGTFTRVGDDQMLALERLAAIFEGALPKHRKNPTPPQSKSTTVIHLRGYKLQFHLRG